MPRAHGERRRVVPAEEALGARIGGVLLAELPPVGLEGQIVEVGVVAVVPQHPADLPRVGRATAELGDGPHCDRIVDVAEALGGTHESGMRLAGRLRGGRGEREDVGAVGFDVGRAIPVERRDPGPVDGAVLPRLTRGVSLEAVGECGAEGLRGSQHQRRQHDRHHGDASPCQCQSSCHCHRRRVPTPGV